MVTENPVRIIGTKGARNLHMGKENMCNVTSEELGFRGNRKFASPNRSGSAPPSIEGSSLAIAELTRFQNSRLEGIFENLSLAVETSESEEQLRADPAYHAYYYSNVNLNPRLPQPLASRENRHFVHHVGAVGGSSRMSSLEEIAEDSQRQGIFGFTSAQYTSSSQSRRKSLVDLIQEDFPRTPSPVYNNQSRLLTQGSIEQAHPDPLVKTSQDYPINIGKDKSKTIVHVHAHTPIPCSTSSDIAVDTFSINVDSGILPTEAAGSGHGSVENETKNLTIGQVQIGQPQIIHHGIHSPTNSADNFSHFQLKLPSVMEPVLQSARGVPPLNANPVAYGNPYYANVQPSSLFSPLYALNSPYVPSFMTGYPPYSTIPVPFESPGSPSFRGRTYGQSSFPNPIYMPYFQHPSADQSIGKYDLVGTRGSNIGSPIGHYDPQRVPLPSAQSFDQRPHTIIRGGTTSPHHFGSLQNIDFVSDYSSSPLTSPVFQGSSVTAGRRNDNLRLQANTGRTGGSFSGLQGQRVCDKVDEQKTRCFLEELKYNKSRRYELSDIAGSIVGFSADQHGSRFIQQKLETCSDEEKAVVFKEILPHASTLMTDVFGNYVIQKFFEYGSAIQRKELATKLAGNILSLSLQMYGCRVIQKALEVIELDQKIQLVLELDGHVMRCVRDQNGNHVIQKCIECIPTDRIDFIVSSFYGNVASLSVHPYGCRVIQRILEHCTDDRQSQYIVNEILQSACILAQDQYGNYVIQHVLERGRTLERSQIISRLAGQIVQMSQHKFASNVIEKCLERGTTEERDILIQEIVGQTEGNDNLLMMMKDQFANYVVQKILDTCKDEQQEILLGRIKVHLPALRKYTYGKHIVARVEQLCGEDSLALE